jgi:uncharacterized protein YkwD
MERRTLVIVGVAGLLAVGGLSGLMIGLQPTVAASDSRSSTTEGVALLRAVGSLDHPTPTPTPPAPPPAEPAPPAEPEAAAPPPAPSGADPAEADVLSLVNAQRAANGCGALSGDEGLASVARQHSADMAARDYFSHTTPEGVDPFQRAEAAGQSARAENIAAGQQSAAAVMEAWMASQGHRENILNCSFTRLGVGVGYGGSYGIYWTQLFG